MRRKLQGRVMTLECAADHMQLAEWLRQARGAEKAARWYTARIHELNGENMVLEMDKRGIKACYDNLSAQYSELETENEKIRELVQYILDESYGDDWFATKAMELGFEANY